MKMAFITFAATVTGTASLAHGGAHIHPHGIDASVVVLTIVALGVAALAVVRK